MPSPHTTPSLQEPGWEQAGKLNPGREPRGAAHTAAVRPPCPR